MAGRGAVVGDAVGDAVIKVEVAVEVALLFAFRWVGPAEESMCARVLLTKVGRTGVVLGCRQASHLSRFSRAFLVFVLAAARSGPFVCCVGGS